MTGRRLLTAGPTFIIIIALAAISAGAIWPSADRVVALGVMLLLPLLAAIAGCVMLLIGLTGSRKAGNVPVGRILAVAALVGLVLAFGFGALGIVSQIPDTVAGLNGSYLPGPAPGLAALTVGSEGIVAGLVVGGLASLAVWLNRRRDRSDSVAPK